MICVLMSIRFWELWAIIVGINPHIKPRFGRWHGGSSWKCLSADFFGGYIFNDVCDYPPAFVNGTLHWSQYNFKNNRDYCIASFDMSSELFGKVMLPEGVRKDRRFIMYHDYK